MRSTSNIKTVSVLTQNKRNLQFMKELRYMFGLMVASKRKYIDPSKAVDILKEAFTSMRTIFALL